MRRGFVPSIIVLAASAAGASADIPPGPHVRPPLPAPLPPAPAPVVVPLVVDTVLDPLHVVDSPTRLRLPGSLVKQAGAAGAVVDAPRVWTPTPTGTVVAGLAVSAAAVLGGLWMLRRPKPKRRWIGAGVAASMVAVVIGLGGCLPGQIPPWMVHREEEHLQHLKPEADGVLAGKALLEVGDTDDSARLTIDPDDLAAWAAKAEIQPADAAASGPAKD